MKIPTLPFTVTDWAKVEPIAHPGEKGFAYWRTLNVGDIRIRHVEYSPGYLADHWCSKGHILYVISGSLTIEHGDDKESYELTSGMSWQTADDGSPHRVRTTCGATVFIVD